MGYADSHNISLVA